MVENQIPSKDLTILDIFSIIRKKIKLVAWIALISLILGAAGGTAWAFISNATYGTEAEFYIYSEGANSYILSLLRSDSFAERLLLDENGLPADKKGTEAYTKALAAKADVDAKLKEIEALEKKILLYPTELSNLQRMSNDAQSKYTEVYNHLVLYKNALADTVFDKDAHNKTIARLETELSAANTAKVDAKKAYEDKLLESQLAETNLLDLQNALNELNAAKKAAYDVALKDFRSNEDNIKKIKTIKNSVTFEYAKSTTKDTTLEESQSHLYVNIAVKFDKQLAQELLDSISKKLSPFVEESVIAEAEERETECVFLSVFGSVETVDYKNPALQAALFAAIAAVVAVTVTCICIVIAHVVSSNSPVAEKDLPEVEAADDHPALEETTEE